MLFVCLERRVDLEKKGRKRKSSWLFIYMSHWGSADLFIVEFIVGVPRWGAHMTGQVENEEREKGEPHTTRLSCQHPSSFSRRRRRLSRSTTLEQKNKKKNGFLRPPQTLAHQPSFFILSAHDR